MFAPFMMSNLWVHLPTLWWMFSSFWPKMAWPPCPTLPIHPILPRVNFLLFHHVSDKRLVSRICKELLPKQQQQNNLMHKCTKDLNWHFFKEDIQMACKHMKTCWTLLVITEMQIKTSMRYHFTVITIVIIKERNKIIVGKNVGKLEISCIAGGNVRCCSHWGK